MKKRVTTYKMRELAPEIQETKYDTEAVISPRRGRKVVERSVKRKRKSVRFPFLDGMPVYRNLRSEVRMLT